MSYGDVMYVSANVKNTGTRKGAEIVQLYVSFPGSANHHDINRKLVGFERVELEPLESKTVTIPVKYDQLSYYDDNTHNFKVEAGTVNLYVSASSDDDRLTGSISTTAATVKETYLSDPIITAINDVKQPAEFIHAKSDVYDLMGRKVSLQTSNLKKGMYIINGKKIVIK